MRRVKALRDGTMLGVGINNQLLYVRRGGSSNWVQVPNSCCLIDVDELPDGRLLGLGSDSGSLWLGNLTASNTLAGTASWTIIANASVSIVAIATPTGGSGPLQPPLKPQIYLLPGNTDCCRIQAYRMSDLFPLPIQCRRCTCVSIRQVPASRTFDSMPSRCRAVDCALGVRTH